jgi:hypothetical protein
MNHLFNTARSVRFLLTSTFLFGCSGAEVRISEPVGPDPVERSVVRDGQLIVYTQEEEPRVTSDNEVATLGHASYSILDIEGNLVRRVEQHCDPPVAASLPPGDYVIRARWRGAKAIEVRVHVAEAKATTIYLDGSARVPTHDGLVSQVRAPDGTFIGWRAQ